MYTARQVTRQRGLGQPIMALVSLRGPSHIRSGRAHSREDRENGG